MLCVSGLPGSTTSGARFGPSGGPLCGSTQAACSGTVNTTSHGHVEEMASRSRPGHSITGCCRIPVKASSQGPGGVSTRSPVGIPSASRTSISSAPKVRASGGSPSASTRRNHGCQPSTAGIGSSASSVIETSRPSASRTNRWVTRPRNGQRSSSSMAIVTGFTTRHGRSKTTPWIAWGGIPSGR